MQMRIAVLAVVALVSTSTAHAAGNVEAGRRLVNTSCNTCHVAPEAPAGTDAAPPFAAIARDNRERPGWIRTWLTDPHPPMQGISLTRQQIDDVVAYLTTLPVQ